MSSTATNTRPSFALYCRTHAETARVLDEVEGPYGFGWEAAHLDRLAGLPPMTEAEMEGIWHADYTEGYLDYFS